MDEAGFRLAPIQAFTRVDVNWRSQFVRNLEGE
jgi:hypothetical protein